MAIGTSIAQRVTVLVILPVAANAVLGRLFEHGALVAILAVRLGVFTQQGEAASVMVEASGLFPAALAVAACAVFTQGFLVLVILGMACIAILAQFDTVNIACVASHAGGGSVLAAQYISGISVVIEAGGFPLVDAMARITSLTKLTLVTFVVVILFVAANAGARRVFIDT